MSFPDVTKRVMFRTDNPHKGNHVFTELDVGCSDRRFLEAIEEFYDFQGKEKGEPVRLPGGIRFILNPETRPLAKEKLSLLITKHETLIVNLFAHQNCADYSQAGHVFGKTPTEAAREEEFYTNQLLEAARILLEWFPHLSINLIYLRFTDQEDEIEAIEINPAAQEERVAA